MERIDAVAEEVSSEQGFSFLSAFGECRRLLNFEHRFTLFRSTDAALVAQVAQLRDQKSLTFPVSDTKQGI
jgi:hypothetical protein